MGEVAGSNISTTNMRASIIVLAVLPLMALADTGSFVRVQNHAHGHEYSHGSPHHAPAPVYHEPAPVYTTTTTTTTPAPYVPPTPAPYEPTPPAPYHPEPSYQPAPYVPAPASYHPAPYHPAPSYGYEPQANCSVENVSEYAEVCVPAFETACTYVELDIKKIVDKEQCNTITRTVCTEGYKTIPNKICSYKYQEKTDDAVATTVKVTFKKSEHTTYVSQCEPAGYGHGGYGGYGQQYCRDVPQITKYNSPVVTPDSVAVKVIYPEAVSVCVNKPISLPIITCRDVSEEKCITVPYIAYDKESVKKCETKLAAPSCSKVTLTLPKQVSIETAPAYGYGHH